ncbi:hypothetical protein ACF0H5_011308 [Mactra antiquata]
MEDYEQYGLLHDMFITQARKTPDNVAVIDSGGNTLTFKQLDHLTETLATDLKLRGVKPDTCVAIYMDKSIEYVISYIAILRAGGAYLPLDISYPDVLLTDILQDAKPVAIVTDEHLKDRVKDRENVIILKKGWEEMMNKENAGKNIPEDEITLDNLAYIVYSSGTTGKPKGIKCPHRGAVFSYHSRHTFYPYDPDEREACNVFFVWELLRPLIKGIPLYIIPSTVIYDPPLLCRFLYDNKITRMLFTPSLLEAVLNTPDIVFKDQLKNMRTIVFCGEVVTTGLFEKCMKELPWIRFLNLYSVSECHDVACENLNEYFNKNKDALVTRKFCPVGKVIPGVHIVIVDSDMKQQPVGSSGEIYVGGPTLAHGYLNRPEIQAKRFVTRPDSVKPECGDILYRSGDWGYMLSDGSLEICGRCDTMVKVRGYSIEIQAVEAALMELPMIHSCVVLMKGEEGEDKFLVTYIVPIHETSKKQVREALKKRLPFYMIPSYFVFISKIPVVPATGKLDKSALPPYDSHFDDKVINEGQPITSTEVDVASVWCKVLQMHDPDIHESFFDLGGHSLLATELINRLRGKFKVTLSVQELFFYTTVSSLSKLIDSKLNVDVDKPVESDVNTVDLLQEVEKHDFLVVNIDMQLRAFWRIFTLYNEKRFQQGRVLLTGATGFLGAFILRELLLRTKVFVLCLCRELPDISPIERLTSSLRKFGILAGDGKTPSEDQKQLEILYQKRVNTLKGDVALINMGLSDEDYTYACSDVDLVIHAAASVNLVYPYNALSGPNVNGTSYVIKFACTGKIKPIHYISTDAVFPTGMTGCSETDDVSSYYKQLDDGYSQSKWVSEQLMRRASQRGIPVTIYRLGNMSGDSQHAYWNPQDFTLILLQACLELGKAPDVNWKMEMTPVDFAAKFIVNMTSKSWQTLGKTFHIINDDPLQSRWIFEWMNSHGFPLQIVSFNEWRQSVLEMNEGGNSVLRSLLESYITSEEFFNKLSTYRADNVHHMLTQLNMSYPYIDSNLLSTYFKYLSQRGIVKQPRKFNFRGKQLQGKVAIVTGASSGIGKNIAIALAEAGAKVAMAARRIDRLQEVETLISQNDGVSISVKTDVTIRKEVEDLVKHTEVTLGPVDILVNNAGVMYYTLMKNLHLQEWDTTIDVNVKGATNCIGAVLDGMLKRGQGHIVNMSSDAGRKGFAGLAVYSGTKFYIEGLSQGLRQEVCGSGVRVTCIQPGDVKTELLAHTSDQEAKEQFDGSSSHKILEPVDIANAVVYAVTQPQHVGVNEILIEPREAPI